jgi:hypothetical protein
MSQRVRDAEHLGGVLTDQPRTDIPDHAAVRQAIDDWRTAARQRRQAAPDQAPSPSPDGAGQPFVAHDFQRDFLTLAHAMRQAGLPPGQP